MFSRRLRLAFLLMGSLAVALGGMAWWVAGEAEHRILRGRLAADLQAGLLELSSEKLRLQTWSLETLMGARPDPAVGESLLGSMTDRIAALRATSETAEQIDRIRGKGVNNLGAYIKPQYRDVTYFWGIDYHQDIIDWPGRTADFVTLYIYLHDVRAADAPLFLLPGSHAFGATQFPHALERLGPQGWAYGDGAGRQAALSETKLLGPAGTVGIWHPFTLHGTQPTAGDAPRLSLRYLVARGPGPAGLDFINAGIAGPLASAAVRRDLDPTGRAQLSGNAITS